MFGVLDNMEVEVQDREQQVEVREKVEARETEEEDITRKQQTLRHVQELFFYADTSCDRHLEPQCDV